MRIRLEEEEDDDVRGLSESSVHASSMATARGETATSAAAAAATRREIWAYRE